jgi:hypothetical protein
VAETQNNSSPDAEQVFRPAYPDLKPGKPTIQEFLGRVYKNPKYAQLSPENKQIFDEQTYDKFVVPYYQKIAKKDPPDKNLWMSLTPQKRQKLPDQFTMKEFGADVGEPFFKFFEGGISTLQHVIDNGFEWLKKSVSKGELDSPAWSDLPKDTKTVKGEQDKYEQERQKVHDYFQKRIDVHSQTADYFRKQSHVEQSTTKEILNFGAYGLPKLALWRGVGKLVDPVIGAVGGVETVVGAEGAKNTFKLTGALGTSEGLSKLIASNPVSRFAVRGITGAADGYLTGAILGEDEKGREGWAEATAGIYAGGPIAGAAAKGLGRAGKFYIGNVLGLAGFKFFQASLADTAGRLAMPEPIYSQIVNIKDPLVRKLTAANAKLLNDTAREMFPKSGGYNALPQESKDRVLNSIYNSVGLILEHPLAYSKDTALHAIESGNAEAIKSPVVKQAVQQIRATTKKLTGSPEFEGAAERETERAQAAVASEKLPEDLKGSKPRYGFGNKLFELKFNDPRDLALYTIAQDTKNKAHDRFMSYLKEQFPGLSEQQLVQKGRAVRASIKEKARIGNPDEGPLIIGSQLQGTVGKLTATGITPADAPGAAKKYSPAFVQDTFVKYLSLNMPIEKESDREVMRYWQATNGRIQDKNLAQKIIDTYEDNNPDPNFRAAREQALTEHMEKLLKTQHITPGGDPRGVFRSGEYGTGKRKTKWQKQLDAEAGNIDKGVQKSGIETARTKEGNLQIGADVKNLTKVLGGSLYEDRSAKTVVKELMQNAWDAIRPLGGSGEVKVEKITSDPDFLQFAVTDNGTGMTEEQVYSVFTNLGASGKREQVGASGGFGVAKASIFLLPDKTEVTTVVKEGSKFRVTGFVSTPESITDGKVQVHSQLRDASPLGGTGTRVNTFYAKGDNDYIHAYTGDFVEDSGRSINPPGKLTYSEDGRERDVNTYMDYKSWERKPHPKPNLLATVQPSNKSSDIELYTSEDPNKASDMEKALLNRIPFEVHNNGIFQFKSNYYLPGDGKFFSNVDRVVVNVKPKVDEFHPDYPFTANREGLKAGSDKANNIRELVDQVIQEKIVKGGIEKYKATLRDIYDTLPTISGTKIPIHDAGKRLTPEELKTFTNSPFINRYGRLINQLGNEVKEILGTKAGQTVERFGLVLSSDVHGVYIPNPSEGIKAGTVFVNPFSMSSGIEMTPDTMASNSWHTLIHEITHDVAKGHNETFTITLGQLFAKIGSAKQYEAMSRIERLYNATGYPKSEAVFDKEFERLLEIYKESRGREKVAEDVLGGEK